MVPAMSQMTIGEAMRIAIEHHQAGHWAEAEGIYGQILAQVPGHADALHLLGALACQTGRPEPAIDLIGRAIALNPAVAEYHGNLGLALSKVGRLEEAIAAFRQALSLRPDYAEAHINLGVVFKAQGRPEEAIASYQRAIELEPDLVEAQNNLGNVLKDRGRLEEAIAAYERAIRSRPGYASAYNNLGVALKELGQLEEAIAAHRRAIALRPGYAEAHNNLGHTLKEKGLLDEALACFRRAVELEPCFSSAASNLVYCLHFHPHYDAPMILAEHRRWDAQFAAPVARTIQPHSNDPALDRRLRIGYVSPDFRNHCQRFFTVPLFASHDHQNFEIFCYSHVLNPDETTARLRSCADVWRDIVGLDDEQVAHLARQDQIDILVDLTMHMAQNRLLVFARKPAPVQVSWLAYPGTTGLTTIDYRLTDPYLDPPGCDDTCYVEESVRLPDTFWCYDPQDDEAVVGALPARANGFVTFGNLSHFAKVNAPVLELWARVLRAVDGSRLLMLASEGPHRRDTLERLEQEGIAPSRVAFLAPQPHRKYLEKYQGIDLVLDTFPYNGHTTSLDALWMGVPIVTLVGRTAVSRAGLSQLANLGLLELAAATPEQFVAIAVELAGDFQRLGELRTTLRERMRSSPLMDAPRFARGIEAAYRSMWQRWCARASAPRPRSGAQIRNEAQGS
jgi:predicted O-linked N-acetylglucosamine transferase (SPINDLY family)